MSGLQSRPAQRLLVQGVMTLTEQLVRATGEYRDAEFVRRLLAERQRLLRELGNGIRGDAELGCYEALTGAVTESEAALETMTGSA